MASMRALIVIYPDAGARGYVSGEGAAFTGLGHWLLSGHQVTEKMNCINLDAEMPGAQKFSWRKEDSIIFRCVLDQE